MADNNKVTIDAAWFAELYAAKKDKEQYAEALSNIARERDELKRKLEQECASCPAVKERDELKAKLSTAQNYEAVIAAKDREIEAVKQERNRLNAKVNELKAKLDGGCKTCVSQDEAKVLAESLAAAELCIEDIERNLITLGDFERRVFDVLIRAWREKREAK